MQRDTFYCSDSEGIFYLDAGGMVWLLANFHQIGGENMAVRLETVERLPADAWPCDESHDDGSGKLQDFLELFEAVRNTVRNSVSPN